MPGASILITAAYLIGSIPFGYLLARVRGIDILTRGSGNIGATNVWRVMGPRFGLPCFILDVLKGLVPSLAAAWLCGTFTPMPRLALTPTQTILVQLAVAVAAILGHVFPVWLKFKGGKGVATSFGALVGIWPVFTLATLLSLAVWLISARLTRMVGISSCIAALALVAAVVVEAWQPRLGLSTLILGPASDGYPRATWIHAAFACALGALVIYTHRANLARTLAGTENRLGAPRSQSRT